MEQHPPNPLVKALIWARWHLPGAPDGWGGSLLSDLAQKRWWNIKVVVLSLVQKEMSWKLIYRTLIFLRIQTPGQVTTDHPSGISLLHWCCSANLGSNFLPRKRWQQTKPKKCIHNFPENFLLAGKTFRELRQPRISIILCSETSKDDGCNPPLH